MSVLLALAMLAPSPSADKVEWIQEPDANVAARSFMCSREPTGFGYLVFAKTPEQNFVEFWEKQAGDTPREDLLNLQVKGVTKFASSGKDRFLITADNKSGSTVRLELWTDAEMGLKGRYRATVGSKVSSGECSLIAMLPGYENFK